MTTKSTAEIISENIVSAERSRNWVANKAGLSANTLNRKLNGGSDFTVNEVARISRALGVPAATLLPVEFGVRHG